MPKKFKYRNRYSQCSASFDMDTLSVIRDRIFVDRSLSFERPLGIEDRIERCAEVIAELCETLGLDASVFNSEFESKVEK